MPAAAGPARGVPGVDGGQRRAQQRSATDRAAGGRRPDRPSSCTGADGCRHRRRPGRRSSSSDPLSAPIGLLALGHGAGGGIDAPDLLAVTALALETGLMVARVRQPYRVAGRRAPAPAAQLDLAWTTVLAHLRAKAPVRALPLIVGGRSSGARVACRTAGATGAVGRPRARFSAAPARAPGEEPSERVGR